MKAPKPPAALFFKLDDTLSRLDAAKIPYQRQESGPVLIEGGAFELYPNGWWCSRDRTRAGYNWGGLIAAVREAAP